MLASRAPSLHNSQPWRWVADGAAIHLFADRKRLLHVADPSGRELHLSCGAVLDHLRVAMSAAGWDSHTERFPDAEDLDHLATLEFSRISESSDGHRQRADAILRRRTDRLPFAVPRNWAALESRIRDAIGADDVSVDVVSDEDRPQLADASRLTEALRRQDPTYQSELRWWTSPFEIDQGVPPSSRPAASEAGRVDVARSFPTAGYGGRRPQVAEDHAKIVVLSTSEDDRDEVLRCGEALSAVLLECTVAGLATCTLTHMTEVAPSRDLIRRLTGQHGKPQLLIRVGRTPATDEHIPATPRRPVDQILEFRS
ncbi:Acg family FMN-binding oxidoreductase [Mycobacterium sp. MMS18-G62]